MLIWKGAAQKQPRFFSLSLHCLALALPKGVPGLGVITSVTNFFGAGVYGLRYTRPHVSQKAIFYRP